MCTGSVYVEHRQAAEHEDLVVRRIPGFSAHKGLYPSDPDAQDQRMVCVRRATKAVIDHFAFDPRYYRGVEAAMLRDFVGITDNAKVVLNFAATDAIICPNGNRVYLSTLADGVRVTIGQPEIKTDKGVAVIEHAVAEASKISASLKDKVPTMGLACLLYLTGLGSGLLRLI